MAASNAASCPVPLTGWTVAAAGRGPSTGIALPEALGLALFLAAELFFFSAMTEWPTLRSDVKCLYQTVACRRNRPFEGCGGRPIGNRPQVAFRPTCPTSELCQSQNAGLADAGFAEKAGGLFGRGRVDVEASPPFEAGHLRELGHDFQVPMVVRQRGIQIGRAHV